MHSNEAKEPRVLEGKQISSHPYDTAAGRQTGKGVLRERAERMRRAAKELDALADALPEKVPLEADNALWQLATRPLTI